MNCRAITNIVLYLHEPNCTMYYLAVPMYIHAIYHYYENQPLE